MTATVTVSAVEIRDDDGLFSIARDGDAVRVNWPCGDSRRFSLDDLPDVIANVDALVKLGDQPSPVWLKVRDTNGSFVYVRADGDRVRADTSMTNNPRGVEWKALKNAIKKATG